jgi:hypothetical protein
LSLVLLLLLLLLVVLLGAAVLWSLMQVSLKGSQAAACVMLRLG